MADEHEHDSVPRHDRRGDREDEQALLGGLSLGELPEQLRPEFERQLNVSEAILELASSTRPPAPVGRLMPIHDGATR